jgi:hypothetical protein
MKILFIGNLNNYSRSKERYEAMLIKHEVTSINTHPRNFVSDTSKTFTKLYLFFHKISAKFGGILDPKLVNIKLLFAIVFKYFDIIWIEKNPFTSKHIIRLAKVFRGEIKVIHYSNDALHLRHNQYKNTMSIQSECDISVIIKGYPKAFIRSLNAKKVIDVNRSHASQLLEHKGLIQNRKYDIVFIGRYEKERALSIINLAKNINNDIHVWGNAWNKLTLSVPKNLIIMGRPIWNDEFIQTVLNAKVVLNFLRKINDDVTTGRSVEIPALGRCMVAEASNEHLFMFENLKEAYFFNSDYELIEQVRFVLSNKKHMANVERAAWERMKSGDFLHETMISRVLSEL